MTESPGTLFERLLDIMTRLRGAGGCPWDREQTRDSLKPYLIEEAYEFLEAIDERNVTSMREELGDLLFQTVFHAQIGAECQDFTMADVLHGLIDKMVSRHPHVFADASVASPDEALAQWEAIKGQEAERRGTPRSVVDGVPRALPALIRAQRLQSKAARVQFDWPDARAAWDKVEEETREVVEAFSSGDADHLKEELGDLLFAVVNVARLSSIDAEDALHAANQKFRRRFGEMEAALMARGASVRDSSPAELDRAWEATKARERS